jgi:hypothetical protein
MKNQRQLTALKKEGQEKNKTEVKTENKIIMPYSAKNNNTKPTLENSTLKPDTNSLSPSAKSKGAR